MKTYIREGIVTALTSISHIGESRGVESKLRREKFVQPDGTVEEVPTISGNGMRGLLRDRGMLHFCRALSYGVSEETGEVRGLSLAAFYFLFSGGALEKTGARGLDVDMARRLRELIPLIGIFGGAMGNQIMPGRAKVGKLIPICAETAHLLPARFVNGHGEQSVWEYLQREAYTRKDDEKDERLRPLLEPATRQLLEVSAAAKREKARQPDALDEDAGAHQQMRYYIETFAAGTQFYWELCLDDPTPVEYDAFHVALAEFARLPFVGGKSGTGHGKVAVNFGQWLEIDPRLAPTGHEVATPLGQAYREHLAARGDEIRSLLDALR
jgi:CRISPR type IV-associated protein Csf2